MTLVDLAIFAVGAAALDTLRVEEQAGVLELLLWSAPRLATDAERIARELLADTGVETVAEEVEWGLRSRGDPLCGRGRTGA